MRRRQVLSLLSASAAARWLAGCDRLVVLDAHGFDALDPITPIDRFYVYQYGLAPDLDPGTHRTAIAWEDRELGGFDAAFLASLPAREKEHTLVCIGASPRVQNIGNARWEGLPLVEVLDALGIAVPAGAVGLRLVGADDYHAGIPIADLLDGPVWLVWRMNGEPLPAAHGAPARLLVPGRYGVKNLKWLSEIAFVREPHVSYWTPQGWSEEATYRPHTFVASPLDGFELPEGPTRFVGTAFAGRDPVTRVEYAVDGAPWRAADLDYGPGGPDVWVLWSFEWTARPGRHTVQVRCITAAGDRSARDPGGTDPLAGYDGSMSITVRT